MVRLGARIAPLRPVKRANEESLATWRNAGASRIYPYCNTIFSHSKQRPFILRSERIRENPANDRRGCYLPISERSKIGRLLMRGVLLLLLPKEDIKNLF